MELCIDTSTRYASVAVSMDGAIAAQLSWRSARNHSVELVEALRLVMERSRVAMDDLDAVFVARGPGGFSALRVGISFAKSLAMATGAPLVGVGTLDAEALPYLESGRPVCAAIEAGRRALYVGLYDQEAPRRRRRSGVPRRRLGRAVDRDRGWDVGVRRERCRRGRRVGGTGPSAHASRRSAAADQKPGRHRGIGLQKIH